MKYLLVFSTIVTNNNNNGANKWHRYIISNINDIFLCVRTSNDFAAVTIRFDRYTRSIIMLFYYLSRYSSSLTHFNE